MKTLVAILLGLFLPLTMDAGTSDIGFRLGDAPRRAPRASTDCSNGCQLQGGFFVDPGSLITVTQSFEMYSGRCLPFSNCGPNANEVCCKAAPPCLVDGTMSFTVSVPAFVVINQDEANPYPVSSSGFSVVFPEGTSLPCGGPTNNWHLEVRNSLTNAFIGSFHVECYGACYAIDDEEEEGGG